MRSRLDRTELLVLLTLLASGSVILFFRFFITVDGPMHVLHASVLEQHWTTPRYVADGVSYDTRKLDVQVGDLVLIVLLRLFPPETSHDVFAVLVTLVLGASIVLFLRAHAIRPNVGLLWLAPFLFSFILVMGFLHFMLGVAVSLLATGWYHAHRGAPWKAVSGLAMGFLVAWHTHRGAPLLLAILAASTVVFGQLGKSGRTGEADRKNTWGGAVAVVAMLVIATLALSAVMHDVSAVDPPREKEYRHLFILRSLLLLDLARERTLVLTLGVLLILSVGAATIARWRSGKAIQPSDAWLALAVLFSLAPLLIETPKTRLLFVVERCQWIGALFLVMWMAATLHTAKGWIAKTIGIAAMLCLPLQIWRTMSFEHTMAGLEAPHRSAVEAVAFLGSGNVVVPVMAETNWLLQHLGAYVSIRHDGISFTRKEHLNFQLEDPPIPAVKAYLARMSTDRWWLPKHWRSGQRPVVDRIVFIGYDPRERALWLEPWKKMLDRRYILAFDNGYAAVYALDRWGRKEEERRERLRQSSLSTARKAS